MEGLKESERLFRYEVRDDNHGYSNGLGNKIHEHKFCPKCNSMVCSNNMHMHIIQHIIELHPMLRMPKKNANKKRWKQFLNLIGLLGDRNIRHKRH